MKTTEAKVALVEAMFLAKKLSGVLDREFGEDYPRANMSMALLLLCVQETVERGISLTSLKAITTDFYNIISLADERLREASGQPATVQRAPHAIPMARADGTVVAVTGEDIANSCLVAKRIMELLMPEYPQATMDVLLAMQILVVGELGKHGNDVSRIKALVDDLAEGLINLGPMPRGAQA